MSEELKPCPFCGRDAIVGNRNDPFKLGGMVTNGPAWMTIGCLDCRFYLCEQDYGSGPGKVLRLRGHWNTRASDSKEGNE